MQVQPYLMFDGRTEEALNFYKSKLGAEVSAMMRFKECPDQSMCAPGSGEKIMHSCFKIGDTAVMASDGECGGKANFQGFSLALNAANPAEAERLFNALSDGGTGADAADRDLLLAPLRHGRRPLRRVVDGRGGTEEVDRGTESDALHDDDQGHQGVPRRAFRPTRS